MNSRRVTKLEENGDLIAVIHNILNRWKGHRFSHVRQMEIYAPEILIRKPSPLKSGISTAKLRSCKSTGTEQLLAEMIQAGGEILRSEIHKLINSICNEE
jgi:hypothetical protein